MRLIRGLLFTLCAAALARVPAAHAAVSVALMPADTAVAPGTSVELALEVTAAGSPFNGFEIVVGYDAAGLTFEPLDPIMLQQGCLMTGGCSAACGTTFHLFEAAGDSLTITDILLCDQVSLTGPGRLYHLRFQASNTPQVTEVRIRSATFYDGGVFVGPVVTADAIVRIDAVLAVDDAGPAGFTLRPEPNPARGPIHFSIGAPADGLQRLEAFDAGGRLVRRIESAWHPAGARRARWDGLDEAGRSVPPGVYVVVLRSGGETARARVAIVR